jgi:hypothetical protein
LPSRVDAVNLELAKMGNNKRNRDGKVATKKVGKIVGDGNCGPESLLKAVKEWPRDAKRGLNFKGQQEIRNKVAQHARDMADKPALREQFFEGRFEAEASPAQKNRFVSVWAARAEKNRDHVDLLFCRLFANMLAANLTIYEHLDNELKKGHYKLRDEDSELLREAQEGREIELYYSSALQDGRRTGHYDVVMTTWA